MRPLQLLILFLLIQLPITGFAQDRLTIDGPTEVETCDLVRLKVNLQEGESALWIVEPIELDYEPLGDRIIFSLACVKEARVTVIAASVVNERVIFRQLRHRVRVGRGSNPPSEPNEPTDPGDDPGDPDKARDWSSAKRWIAKHSTVKADRETASAYASKLASIQSSLSRLPLGDGRKLVGNVRREVFGTRSSFEVDWNPFLIELDRRIAKQPPKTSTEFASLIKAMTDGLKPNVETESDSRENTSSKRQRVGQ